MDSSKRTDEISEIFTIREKRSGFPIKELLEGIGVEVKTRKFWSNVKQPDGSWKKELVEIIVN